MGYAANFTRKTPRFARRAYFLVTLRSIGFCAHMGRFHFRRILSSSCFIAAIASCRRHYCRSVSTSRPRRVKTKRGFFDSTPAKKPPQYEHADARHTLEARRFFKKEDDFWLARMRISRSSRLHAASGAARHYPSARRRRSSRAKIIRPTDRPSTRATCRCTPRIPGKYWMLRAPSSR